MTNQSKPSYWKRLLFELEIIIGGLVVVMVQPIIELRRYKLMWNLLCTIVCGLLVALMGTWMKQNTDRYKGGVIWAVPLLCKELGVILGHVLFWILFPVSMPVLYLVGRSYIMDKYVNGHKED